VTSVQYGTKIFIWGGQNYVMNCNASNTAVTGAPYCTDPTSLSSKAATCAIAFENGVGCYFGDGGIYDLPTGTWTYLAPTTNSPGPRANVTSVLAGTKIILYSGDKIPSPTIFMQGNSYYWSDGYMYDTTSTSGDPWTAMSTASCATNGGPAPPTATGYRFDNKMMWLGPPFNYVLLLMPVGSYGYALTTLHGYRFDPVNNCWLSEISMTNGPLSSSYSMATYWTGKKVLFWGGQTTAPGCGGVYDCGPPTGSSVSGGYLYDPNLDQWSSMTGIGQPSQREVSSSQAVWTGSNMVLYGGCYNSGWSSGCSMQTDGFIYSPP
jgi:hypothetical protein